MNDSHRLLIRTQAGIASRIGIAALLRRGLRRLCWLAALGVVATSAHSSVTAAVARAPMTWLIVVDDLHLDFRNTGRIRDTMKTIVSELVLEGDRFAMASTGPSGVAVELTADRLVLNNAIRKTVGNALKYEDVVATASGPVEARYRASVALATAQEALNNFARLPDGPRALLFVSNGYDIDILPDLTSQSPRLGRGRDFSRSEVREQLNQLMASATRASVRIFAVDPRVAFDDPVAYPPDPAWPAHRSAMRSALQSISDGSGGFAIVDGDFVNQLRRVADTMHK